MFEKLYKKSCETKSDINEHLPTILQYAKECKHITEMGVRTGVSTTAFLHADPDKLISYDIILDDNVTTWFDYAKKIGKDYSYIKADTLKIKIEPTDLLFLDTVHQYRQVKAELILHAGKVNKYIIFHDTETFGERGQDPTVDFGYDGHLGIWYAIEEFLKRNSQWKIVYKTPKNNGLTIIEKRHD